MYKDVCVCVHVCVMRNIWLGIARMEFICHSRCWFNWINQLPLWPITNLTKCHRTPPHFPSPTCCTVKAAGSHSHFLLILSPRNKWEKGKLCLQTYFLFENGRSCFSIYYFIFTSYHCVFCWCTVRDHNLSNKDTIYVVLLDLIKQLRCNLKGLQNINFF